MGRQREGRATIVGLLFQFFNKFLWSLPNATSSLFFILSCVLCVNRLRRGLVVFCQHCVASALFDRNDNSSIRT